MKKYWRLFTQFIRKTASLHEDADVELTISRIEKGVEFKGCNVWILAFAIIVASVGLNVNSTAVIIGAMLISPLMGPIMGLGLSIGINDSALLRRSLKNLFIMVIISLIASTTYFIISPLSDAQSELLARTTPTIYDVFIAFFGGLAGIVASSRKDERFTVVSGVAIATALMPPLCTAGFGLASLNFSYFIGAFYLFFINSFFIALATFLIVRYLNFPPKVFLDKKKGKKVKKMIYTFTIIVMIPSIFMAISMIKETSFNTSVSSYVNYAKNKIFTKDNYLLDFSKNYSSKKATLSLTVVGTPLTEVQKNELYSQLETFDLKNVKLVIKEASGIFDPAKQNKLLEEVFEKNQKDLEKKENDIALLSQEIQKLKGNIINSEQIAKEISIQAPEITRFFISRPVYLNPKTLQADTIPTLYCILSQDFKDSEKQKFETWLKIRLNLNRLEVIYKFPQPSTSKNNENTKNSKKTTSKR